MLSHCYSSTGYTDPRWWTAGGPAESEAPGDWDEQLLHPNRPALNVSWYEALAYCAWAGVRLPTEAEWKRATRGWRGGNYPWGIKSKNEAGELL